MEEQANSAVEAAKQHFGRIDVLVSNAGYGLLGAIEEASTAEVEAIDILKMSSLGGYRGSDEEPIDDIATHHTKKRWNCMQHAIETRTNPIIHAANEPTVAVVGTLLQFISTPERNGGNISVMRGGIPPRAVIPLHSHASPEIFYVLAGTMEVFQDDGKSSSWQTAEVGDAVTIAGGVKHALRNPLDTAVAAVLVSDEQLYHFFGELGDPLGPGEAPPIPTPEVMQRLFEVAARYGYWIGSPEDNALIGILVGKAAE